MGALKTFESRFLEAAAAWRMLSENSRFVGRTQTIVWCALGRSRQVRLLATVCEYPEGTGAAPHRDLDSRTDPIWNVNLMAVLRRARKGGEFLCERPWWRSSRVVIFDGTRSTHEVSKVEEGKRVSLILLCGVAKVKESVAETTVAEAEATVETA